MLLAGCASEAELVDGEYRAVSDSAGESGWVAALDITVQEGSVDEASFEYVSDSGDLLTLQAAATEEFEEQYGVSVPEYLQQLEASLIDRSSFPDGADSGEVDFIDRDFEALSGALFETASEGAQALQNVDTGAGGEVSDVEAISRVLDGEYRHTDRAAARGGVSAPGEPSGGWAVVASHWAAVEAGMEVLEAGGTAADAVVTVASVMSVVEPFLSSALGGGTWLLYYDAESGEVHSVDGVGPTPRNATAELFEDDEYAGSNGLHRAIIPGSWGGYMELLKEFGSMPLDELVEPAADWGEQGVPASAALENWLPLREEFVREWEPAREKYMSDGEFVTEGDVIYYEDMAATFRELGRAYRERRHRGEREALEASADYFYRGPIAESLTEFSQENDGLFSLSDFNDFENYGLVEPLSVSYRGLDVFQNPPNSQGITQLQSLNILEEFDLASVGAGNPEAIHLIAESIKLSFADRNRYVADPATTNVPVDTLLSREHAIAQRELISRDSALEHPIEDLVGMNPADPSNTSTFHVVDRYGNAAAVTSSIGLSFMIAGDTGIHLNERISFMNNDPDDVNSVAPGKKVRHSAGPYMVLRDEQVYIAGGNTGADFQPQGQLQQLVNIVDFGMSAQEAVDAPRFQPQAFAATNYPFAVENRLALEEDRYEQSVFEDLRRRGQDVEEESYFGRQNVIVVNDHSAGDLETGAESREADSRGMVGRP